MPTISLESENEALQRTIESSYCPAPIREARQRQDRILGQQLRQGPYNIADIGCGNGYHAVLLAPVARLYHGFEISPLMAEAARELWRNARPDNARIFVGDAAQAAVEEAFYDVILCLYFTAGNIRDKSDDLSLYGDAYLDRNPRFIDVISRFYRALKAGGSMFLTLYKDVPEARRRRSISTSTRGSTSSHRAAAGPDSWRPRKASGPPAGRRTACCPISTRAESAPTASPGTA